MKINGFTLLEMLLVLTISFTLITLTIFPISSTLSTLREKQLLEEINAVATNQDTFISFDPTKNQLITYTNSKTLVIIPFSQTLTLTQPKIGNFRFSSTDGSINRFSTIHLTSSTNNYKLIFQIGKGRFRIEQN
ncbi:type II secretion system protein [Listeria monocytogenes]|nr:type II secretion system protein [Listeria monocytogenes]